MWRNKKKRKKFEKNSLSLYYFLFHTAQRSLRGFLIYEYDAELPGHKYTHTHSHTATLTATHTHSRRERETAQPKSTYQSILNLYFYMACLCICMGDTYFFFVLKGRFTSQVPFTHTLIPPKYMCRQNKTNFFCFLTLIHRCTHTHTYTHPAPYV